MRKLGESNSNTKRESNDSLFHSLYYFYSDFGGTKSMALTDRDCFGKLAVNLFTV